MVRKSILPRSSQSGGAVERVVEKARTEAGVERILVVYEGQDARVYVEKERRRRKQESPRNTSK